MDQITCEVYSGPLPFIGSTMAKKKQRSDEALIKKLDEMDNSRPWEILDSVRDGYLYISRIQAGERCTVACFQKDWHPDEETITLIEMAPYNAARVKALEKKVRQLQKKLRETKALAVFAAKNDIPMRDLYS